MIVAATEPGATMLQFLGDMFMRASVHGQKLVKRVKAQLPI